MTTIEPQDVRAGKPSASDIAFWNCDGKQQLLASIGPVHDDAGPDALLGTKLHTAFQTGNTLPLSQEEEETYQKGLVFLEQLLQQWQSDFQLEEVREQERELRLWLHDPYTMEPIASGQLDRFYISGTHAAIVDFKTGWTPNLIPSPRSPQLRVYAVLLKKEFPELTNIRVAFCKPLSKAGASDWCDYSLNDLEMAEQMIRFQIWRSQQADARRTPGQHCWWCPCKPFCQEAGAYTLLPGVIAERASVGSTKPAEMVKALTPPDLLRIWSASGTIKRILDAVTDRLKTFTPEQLAELGLMLPEKGRRDDRITDVHGACNFLMTQGFTLDDVWAMLQLTKGKVAERYGQMNGIDEKHAGKWAEEVLAPYITKGFCEPSLKRIKE